MVLAFGFLLLVSLVLTTVLSSMGDLLSGLLPDEVSSVVPVVIHLAVSLS
jgi:hypothetical protein